MINLQEQSYPALITQDGIGQLATIIAQYLPNKRAFIVTDTIVAGYYLPKVLASFDSALVKTVIINAGEQAKSFAGLEGLINQLLALEIERGDLLIALGGGVIGDLTGFCASILKRGIDFVQVPTTLLSQIDSSVGGKTAINTIYGKNMVGSFYQPKLVVIDVTVLSTLSIREMRAGYAEMLKAAIINDPDFFTFLEKNGREIINGDLLLCSEAIARSLRIKADIVAADVKENGIRAYLNLGHSFGHAYEAVTGFSDRLLHGEAVAIGLCNAFDMAVKINLCPANIAEEVKRHMQNMGLLMSTRQIAGYKLAEFAPEILLQHMFHDKKVVNGRLVFILPRKIGMVEIVKNIELAIVIDVLSSAS